MKISYGLESMKILPKAMTFHLSTYIMPLDTSLKGSKITTAAV